MYKSLQKYDKTCQSRTKYSKVCQIRQTYAKHCKNKGKICQKVCQSMQKIVLLFITLHKCQMATRINPLAVGGAPTIFEGICKVLFSEKKNLPCRSSAQVYLRLPQNCIFQCITSFQEYLRSHPYLLIIWLINLVDTVHDKKMQNCRRNEKVS